jgi:hypothetical protein
MLEAKNLTNTQGRSSKMWRAGCVSLDVQGTRLVIRDKGGQDITGSIPGDGSNVGSIDLVSADGALHKRFERNKWGSFFQVFQPNKWQLKRRQLATGMAGKETLMV